MTKVETEQLIHLLCALGFQSEGWLHRPAEFLEQWSGIDDSHTGLTNYNWTKSQVELLYHTKLGELLR
jgi:hypothetical protein